MARATVTGYCWPQSVQVGDEVGLHLSSTDGRQVTIEVARVGQARTVVFAEAGVEVDDHPTPAEAATKGCGWPAVRHLTVDASWRSGYYEVILSIDVDGRPRTEHAVFVVRPEVGRPGAPMLLVLSTNTWHAYNDFGGTNLYSGATQVALQRPMARGYLSKPPGADHGAPTGPGHEPVQPLYQHLRGWRRGTHRPLKGSGPTRRIGHRITSSANRDRTFELRQRAAVPSRCGCRGRSPSDRGVRGTWTARPSRASRRLVCSHLPRPGTRPSGCGESADGGRALGVRVHDGV